MCIALTGACGVSVAPPNGTNSDANTPVDAMTPPDSKPDAAPCVGGTARIVSPLTGHCYIYFATPKDRAGAAAECALLGAKMVSVTTAAENTLVAGLIGDIGAMMSATDQAVEATFRWDSGEPFAFTNYRVGEPNNGGNTYQEDCLLMVGTDPNDAWDDRPCVAQPPIIVNADYPFVCERD
jgi:hypothetical protein